MIYDSVRRLTHERPKDQFDPDPSVCAGFHPVSVRFVTDLDEWPARAIRLIEVASSDTDAGYIEEKPVDAEARTGYVEPSIAGIQ